MNLKTLLVAAAACAFFGVLTEASAVEFDSSLKLNSAYTSNVFLDSSKEYDMMFNPYGNVGIVFADDFGAGYNMGAELFAVHPELYSHWHELYFFYNPAWGEDGEAELLFRVSADTLKNDDAYNQVNYYGVNVLTAFDWTASDWFALKSALYLGYRSYYDARASDYAGGRLSLEGRFTVQYTRTTITPKAFYEQRYYVKKGGTTNSDRSDSQLDAGLHISQGLWDTAGLQFSYFYRSLLGDNSFAERMLASWRFAYLGEDFLYTGHRFYGALTQIFPAGFRLVAGAEFSMRDYGGWKAVIAAGDDLTYDRRDYKLLPSVSLDYLWESESESDYAFLIPSVTAALKYTYIKQWSNSALFDTDAHVVELTIGAQW